MSIEAQSERGDATPTVTVRGEAVIRVEPDEAMLWVTLSALEASPGPALAQVSSQSEAFLSLLDELHVAKSDRSATGVSVYEDFDRTRAGRRSLGHRAAARVVLRLTDPDMIGRIVTRATTEFGAQIDGSIVADRCGESGSAPSRQQRRPPMAGERRKPMPRALASGSDN